eukprot:7147033-Alexandrium_andersonii.AAC.1
MIQSLPLAKLSSSGCSYFLGVRAWDKAVSRLFCALVPQPPIAGCWALCIGVTHNQLNASDSVDSNAAQ